MTEPQDWPTTLGLIGACAASTAACGAAFKRLCCAKGWERAVSRGGVGIALLLTLGLFVYRLVAVGGAAPLSSHVDGLLLLSALLAGTVAYVQWSEHLAGLEIFALPVLAVVTLWAVCASWWTYRPFSIESVWDTVHLVCVFVGMLSAVTAAAAGALWLLVDRQLRAKDHRAERFKLLGRLGDLESVEKAVVRQATVAFVMITLALITGLVKVLGGETNLGTGWWYSPKVVLAFVVWAIFAVVMHVRFLPAFRGRRAAVLSIVGFAILLAVLGIAQAIPSGAPTPDRAPSDAHEADGGAVD